MSTDLGTPSTPDIPASDAAASAQAEASAASFVESLMNKADDGAAVSSSSTVAPEVTPRQDVSAQPPRPVESPFDDGTHNLQTQQPQPAAMQAPTTPKIAGIPDDLVATAQDLGIDPSALGVYRSNPEALRSYLNGVTQSVIAAVAPRTPAFQQQMPGAPFGFPPQQMHPQMQQPMPFQQPPQGAGMQPGNMPQGQQQPPLNRPAGQPSLWNENFKREDYEPEIVDALEKLWEQNQQLTQSFQQMQQFAQQQQQQALMQQAMVLREQQEIAETEAFDAILAKLPAESQALFGKGSFRDVRPNTIPYVNRGKVFGTYLALRDTYQRQGFNPRPEVLFDQAATMALGDHWTFIRQSARSPQQTISRPGRVGYGAEPDNTSDQEAANYIGQFMSERGEAVPRSRQREPLGLLT